MKSLLLVVALFSLLNYWQPHTGKPIQITNGVWYTLAKPVQPLVWAIK